MREILYVILGLVSLILFIKIYRRVRGDLFLVFGTGLILLIFISMMVKVINIHTLPPNVEKVVEDVSKSVGDDSIVRVNSNDEIEVQVNNEWVESSEIDILYWVTEGIVIEYEGEEVKVMDSGLTSALKTLDRLGFLD